MNAMYDFLSSEWSRALGWTAIHSLWQGFLIAIILAVLMIPLQRYTAKARYWAANFSLLLVFASAIITFCLIYSPSTAVPGQILLDEHSLDEISILAYDTAQAAEQSLGKRFTAYFEQHLPLMVSLWLIGLAFFLLRMLGGIAYVQHLKHNQVRQLPAHWNDLLQQLATKMGLQKPITLLESAIIKSPMLIGYLKPVVLMPVGAVNALSPAQVEAVLAHELAHVLRNDYLWNILQSFIEALFYFNPAVWWISANIRLERENCCDDMALFFCNNSLEYAKALVKLQECHQTPAHFAMAFSGQRRQHLLNRVKRILNQPQNQFNTMEKLTVSSLLLLAVLFFSFSNAAPFERPDPTDSILDSSTSTTDAWNDWISPTSITDTLPQGNYRIEINDENRELSAKIRDGKIESLSVNGQAVPEEEFAQYESILEEAIANVPEPPLPPTPPTPPSPPAAPLPPAPPAPPAPPVPPVPPIFNSGRNVQKISTEKRDDGTTVVVIESMGNEEPLELSFQEEDGVVYLDGEPIETGETRVIVHNGEENAFWGWNFDMAPSADGEWLVELQERAKEQAEMAKGQAMIAREELAQWQKEHQKEMEQHLRERQAELKHQKEELKQYQKEIEEEIRRSTKELKDSFTEMDFEDMGSFRFVFPPTGNYSGDDFQNEMLQDGLIDDPSDYRYELTDKYFKVNGEKQPAHIHEKYKALYEALHDEKLGSNSKVEIKRKGN